MFRQVFVFTLNGILESLNLTRRLILDRPLGITFFHFLIFTTFFSIVLKLISFVKQVQEVENEKEYNYNKQQEIAYNEWLRDHPSTPRRFRK